MTEKLKCEFYLAIDEDGDWRVCDDSSDVTDGLSTVVRIVKIAVHITPPQITETELEIPDEAGETKEIEATAA